jgi:hypothetical protein
MQLKTLAIVAVLAGATTLQPAAAGEANLYVFADTPENRAAIATLAATDGIAVAAAAAGDVTVVSLTGNGLDRGLIIDGLKTAGRKAFTYTGEMAATPDFAARLNGLTPTIGIEGPGIVIAPDDDYPDWCIYAICLPDDWRNAAEIFPPRETDFRRGGSFGNGLSINGIKVPQSIKLAGGADGSGV